MQIYENFTSRDILKDTIVVQDIVNLNITTTASTSAIDPNINGQIPSQYTNIYNVNATDSTSSYYNSVKWFFYNDSGSTALPILSGTSSTTSVSASYIKIITVPRETAKDRLVPNSLSATLNITTSGDSTSGVYYLKDYPVSSTSGSALFYGMLKIGNSSSFVATSSLTSVGEIFYNYGTLIFRGSDVSKASLSAFINSKTATFVSGSGTANGRINITSFDFSREQTNIKQIFFARSYNDSFNFSNNPTYRDDTGAIESYVMALGNVTYINSVGIYDNSNNLLAVANVSPVQKKTFEDEVLFKISLVY